MRIFFGQICVVCSGTSKLCIQTEIIKRQKQWHLPAQVKVAGFMPSVALLHLQWSVLKVELVGQAK